MKKRQYNKGFSLIELLISMALLSIIMLMVVQFMSTTTAANKRTKYNLKAQMTSNEVMQNITDSISQANYIRVTPYLEGTSSGVYKPSSGNRKEALEANDSVTIAKACTDKDGSNTSGKIMEFDLVPDDYGNYVRDTSIYQDERKVIVDMDTYQLLGEKNGEVYPLSNDMDKDTSISHGVGSKVNADVRSFRCLKQTSGGSVNYLYVKPAYIYIEYNQVEKSPGDYTIDYVIYRFDYSKAGKCSVYLSRGTKKKALQQRFSSAVQEVSFLTDKKGLLSDDLVDFYLSADAEGNTFMLDCLVDVKGHMFNSATSVSVRNSNVLTPRPQNSYKKEGSGSSESGSSESDSSESGSSETK